MAISNVRLSLTISLWIILFFTRIGGEKLAKEDLPEQENVYYGDEIGFSYIDWMFTAYMFITHVYYAYKFTDYSLSHIHSSTDAKEQKRMERKAKKKIQKQLKKEKQRAYKARKQHSPRTPVTARKLEKIKEEKAVKALQHATQGKNYTTASNPSTSRRAMNVCCCIRCAPRYFTWQRTAIIRLFFRIYTSLSCLLAMVLYMELFINLFVEFFITCIVHYKQGYVVALLLLPLMIYVIETLIRLSWHSVYVSWQINCDNNGDFESVESDGKHHFNLEGNRFLFSFKMDEGDIEDEYDSVYLTTSDSLESTSDSDSSSPASAPNNPVTPYTPDSNNLSKPFNPLASQSSLQRAQDLGPIEEDDEAKPLKRRRTETSRSGRTTRKKRSKSDVDAPKKGKKKQRSHTADAMDLAQSEQRYKAVPMKIDVDYRNDDKMMAFKQLKVEKAKQREARHKQREELRARIQKDRQEAKERRAKRIREQREMMGDYFLATCWRAWFFVGTIGASLVTSYNVNVEFVVNGYFWQLLMRYCIIGGFIWSVVYAIYAFLLSFMSRMMSWNLLHPNLSRIKFFCLVDAKDHEKKNKAWRNCKVFTMASSLMLFAAFIGFGLYLDHLGNDASGFVVFIGIIWILYYFTNLFMSCKPMGLIALWTDTIPPPGRNFFAHLQVSAHLEDAGHLENTLNLSNIDSQQVRIGTNTDLELARFNSEKSENSIKNQRDKPKLNTRKKKGKLSIDEVTSISTTAGIQSPPLTRTKSQEEFVMERVTALLNRYRKFKYKYKEPSDYPNKQGQKPSKWCCKYWCLKMRFFWNNYKNYWLNVYRPFDEYDLETNLNSTQILHGFQWLKPCLECRCFKKTSKSRKVRCDRCCSYLMDNTCNICLIIFSAVLIGTLFFFVSQFGVYRGSDTLVLESTSARANSLHATQYYPICSEYFGADGSNHNDSTRSDTDLTVLDVLFLAQVVYEMDNFKIDEIIKLYFDGEFEIIGAAYEVPFYFHVKHKTEDVDYVAIRGTAGLQEALQDVSLFVEIALFEGLQWLVPFLNALPTSFVTALIYYASMFEQLINADVRDQFDEPIYDYLSTYLDNATTSMNILGHSLGGGISSIVAAKLYEDGYDSYITSFGVCSPGALYSSAKFGFGIDALDKTSHALLPRRDLVSMLDVHGGMVQYTKCEEESMLHCHVMPSVICEVYNNCPNNLAQRPELFDCYCNQQEMKQQFGHCLNATECEGKDCYIDIVT
eukprot:130036_1